MCRCDELPVKDGFLKHFDWFSNNDFLSVMPYLEGNIWGDPIISVHPKKIGWCQVCPATDAATFFPQMFYLSIIIYAWFGNGTKMPWAMHNARLNSRDFFALVLVNRSEACGNIRCIKSHQERDIYVSVVSMSYIENSINPKQSLLPPRWYALKKWCLTWNTNKQNCYCNEF